MSALLDGLMDQFGKGDFMGQLGSTLGLDADATKKGLGASVEGLFGGMKGLMGSDDTKAKLQSALDNADESILDNPASVLTGGGGGQKTMDDLFGGGSEIAEKAAKSSGLDLGSITKMLPMAAPLVLGFAKKFMKGGGPGGSALDLDGLSGMLGGGGFMDKLKGLFS